MLKPIFTLFLLIFLSGCYHPSPMVGGPCSYDSTSFTNELVRLDEHFAYFKNNDTQVPYRNLNSIDNLEIGKTYHVEYKYITSGSCTPYSGSIRLVSSSN